MICFFSRYLRAMVTLLSIYHPEMEFEDLQVQSPLESPVGCMKHLNGSFGAQLGAALAKVTPNGG